VTSLPYLDAAALTAALPWPAAIDAIAAALTGIRTPPRVSVPMRAGELLLMPAEGPGAAGIKVAAVAPANPARGRPRIQAVYVLFDADTLTPRAVLDGTALTTLRVPAQSALAVRHLAAAGAARLVVFGAGPQAWGHVHALRSVRPITDVVVVGRGPVGRDSVGRDLVGGGPVGGGPVGRDLAGPARLVDRLAAAGVPARVGTPDAVAAADIVVCATTAREPVFDGAALAEGACVVAVGSHEPAAREVDDTVFRRATRVVVEQRGVALREAGDVIQAVAAGAVAADRLIEIADLPGLAARAGISVFKSVGMGWQDLALATAAVSGP
jgi:ornithine cyclodeaminase